VTSPAAGSFKDVNHRLRPLHFPRVVRPGDSSHEGLGKPRKPQAERPICKPICKPDTVERDETRET